MGSYLKGVNTNEGLNRYNELLPNRNIEIIKAFKCDKPLGRVIFNCNEYSKDLKNSQGNSICYCHNEKFKSYINPNYNHVLTGNQDIVQNEALRDVMRYGTRYIIKRILTQNSVKKRLNRNLDIFILKFVHKYNIGETGGH